MKILGISGSINNDCHDTSACLIIDGKIVGNYEEERFNRIKHTEYFPILSIKRLLNENHLSLDDIDSICCNVPSQQYKDILNIIDENYNKIPQFVQCTHHEAHICDVFFQSGFNSAAVVIIDGLDGTNLQSITISHVKDGKIKILKQYDLTKSLGLLYEQTAAFCMEGSFCEGKLMGLSSFGKDTGQRLLKFNNETKEIDCFYNPPNFEDIKKFDNSIEIIGNCFENYFEDNFYPNETRDDQSILYYTNIARTIQENFNEVYLDIIKYAKELTGEDNLCVTGGCIQNCIGNNLVVESGIFKNVFAPPAPHDAGVGAGHALYAAYFLNDKIENERLTNSYVGKTYSDDEIKKSFTENVVVEEYSEDRVIDILKSNKIIAWFQGGSEIGPRALGHRSILANPSERNNLNVINDEIKHRENWRPLAPTVPEELFDMVFNVKSHDLTEFMLRTIPIKKEWQKKLIAVCHIDETTRPQRLIRKENPELYDLIMKFYEKMGIPCLINTSFNGKGQPIIETPKQAIEFLHNNKMLDYVVFNAKYIVSRK